MESPSAQLLTVCVNWPMADRTQTISTGCPVQAGKAWAEVKDARSDPIVISGSPEGLFLPSVPSAGSRSSCLLPGWPKSGCLLDIARDSYLKKWSEAHRSFAAPLRLPADSNLARPNSIFKNSEF